MYVQTALHNQMEEKKVTDKTWSHTANKECIDHVSSERIVFVLLAGGNNRNFGTRAISIVIWWPLSRGRNCIRRHYFGDMNALELYNACLVGWRCWCISPSSNRLLADRLLRNVIASLIGMCRWIDRLLLAVWALDWLNFFFVRELPGGTSNNQEEPEEKISMFIIH